MPLGFRTRQLDVPRQPELFQAQNKQKARIGLTRFYPKFCGMREGMVVSVPVLAKRDQAQSGKVVSLNRKAFDSPVLGALSVSVMANHLVTCQRHEDP